MDKKWGECNKKDIERKKDLDQSYSPSSCLSIGNAFGNRSSSI